MSKTATAIIVIIIIALGAWLILRNDSMTAGTNDVNPAGTVEEGSGLSPDDTDPNSGMPDQNSDSGGLDVGVDTTISTGQVKTFSVTSSNYKFTPATMTVNKGDTVRITLKNSGGNHDLKVDGYSVATDLLTTAGQEDTIEFVADKTGTFEYYCTYGNHRQMGMKGVLTVK